MVNLSLHSSPAAHSSTFALLIDNKHTTRKNRREDWLLLLPILLGLMLRLVYLGAHSLLLDEAFVAVGARDIAYNRTPMWDAISNAPFVWLVAKSVGLVGDSPLALRLSAALVGTATLVPFYYLAKRLLGIRTAYLATILLAAHPFAVAFDRILFADPFQVFFIILGWLVIELDREGPATRLGLSLLSIFIWALAFLMKYNAIVPAAAWIGCGVLVRRYSVAAGLRYLLLVTLGSVLALSLWPYDSPVWFFAFLSKGGGYDLGFSTHYYVENLLLILSPAGIVVLLAAFLRLFRDPDADGRSAGMIGLFVLLYLLVVILLGRMFQRYLLVLTPVSSMLLGWAAITLHERYTRTKSAVWLAAGLAATAIVTYTAAMAYGHYLEYLTNDIDHAAFAREAATMERQGRRGFWLVSEPVAAYYLGFTQNYSRAVRPGLDGELARLNYFENQAVPYADETDPYTVLQVRQLARRWGVARILTHYSAFRDSVEQIQFTIHKHPPQATDYLYGPIMRPGDLLLLKSGFRDLEGEPILSEVYSRPGAPYFRKLPTALFDVVRRYTPEGSGSSSDSLIDPVQANGWILIRK